MGHLFRMQELDPYRKLAAGSRRVGKLQLRWLESVEEDLKNMGKMNWKRQSQDREQRRKILEEAKVHQEL